MFSSIANELYNKGLITQFECSQVNNANNNISSNQLDFYDSFDLLMTDVNNYDFYIFIKFVEKILLRTDSFINQNKHLHINNIKPSDNLVNINVNNNPDTIIQGKLTKCSKVSRSSIYRGVSRNGLKWQAILMKKGKNHYLGSYSTPEKAARIYDVFSIKEQKEYWVKTNFFYTAEEKKNIKSLSNQQLKRKYI